MAGRGGGSGRSRDGDGARRILDLYGTHARVTEAFFATGAGQVAEVARVFVSALRAGRTLFFFGNGGSAADAQHLAAEFVNRFVAERPALPALSLATDTSALTSIGNDADFSRIFARQLEAFGREGDVAVGLSTSGRSPNVLRALETARDRGLITVGFTGGDGGAMKQICRHLLLVPSRDTARIQEVHILAGHILCQLVDDALAPPG